MDKLNFYTVDQAYIEELQHIDSRVPNVSYATHNKFLCGVLFNIHGFDYFAPISSFKKGQKTNFLIRNSRNAVVGCLRFSFMIPLPKDLQVIKDFNEEDYKRKRLLMEELEYCRKNERRIRAKAQHVYDAAVSGDYPQIASVRCDFKNLEAYVQSREVKG